MNKKGDKENRRFLIITVGLVFLLLLTFFFSMFIGRYHIAVKDVFLYFLGQQIDDVSGDVITYLRIPRTLVAIMVGCSLSISGTIYQSVFNNKLVSPGILGVSSGASVGACLAILFGFSSFMISFSAFIVGFIAVFLTLLIARLFNNKSNIILILSGLAVGGLMSSLVGLMKYLADSEMQLAEMTFWLLGDISGTTINDFWILLPIVIVGCFISIILSWRLNIVSLGAKEAKTLGVNYKATMAVLIVIATALTAVSVSISGTIGWIGLVIPNIVRLLVGSNNKKVVPLSMLGGAIFMVVVDMLARSLAPNEIPLSVITGLIGTPLFVFAIFKRRKEIQ
jgi:iron complex transport system permease protein